MSKYGNKCTEVDGIQFDSKAEALRYQQLKLLERAGKVRDVQTQVRYTLLDGFWSEGVWVRPVTYIADFVYFDHELLQYVIEDVKGVRTQAFQLKWKLLRHKLQQSESVTMRQVPASLVTGGLWRPPRRTRGKKR